MKTCFMFGHSDCPDTMLPAIEETILLLCERYEIQIFHVGNRGRFDRLAATAVKWVKKRYPDISLRLVLSYHPGERPIPLDDCFDGSFYPPLEHIPRRYAIVKANRYMVNAADAILCYVCHMGNSRNLLEYARHRSNIPVINIAQLPRDFSVSCYSHNSSPSANNSHGNDR